MVFRYSLITCSRADFAQIARAVVPAERAISFLAIVPILKRWTEEARMGLVFLLIIGTAAGFLATRVMRIDADVPTTVVIGIAGALIGGFLLRSLVMITGWLAGFVGAIIGAIVLIWIYKTYISR